MRRALVLVGLSVALLLLACVIYDALRAPHRVDTAGQLTPGSEPRATTPDQLRRGRGDGARTPGVETVVGRVLHHGQPVRDFRVWVDGVETTTDSTGRFEVPGRPRGAHRIVTGGGEYLAEELVIASLERPLRIGVSRPRTREGVLELPPGVPRAGVEVRFRRRGGGVEQVVVTDEAGRFVADRLRPYGHYVDVPSQRIGDWVFFRTSVVAGRFDKSNVRIAPAAGQVIAGTVRAPDGQPVGGARVQARGKWPRASINHLGYATADEQGRFEVIVPKDVAADLIAWDPDGDGRFAATLVHGTVPSPDGAALQLGEGQTVSGVLRGAAGTPLVGARLQFRCARPGMSWVPVVSAVTDRRGGFVAGGLQPGDVRVSLSEEDVKSRRVLLSAKLSAPSAKVVLNAVASLALRGRIVRPAELEGRQLSFGFSRDAGGVDAWRILSRTGEFDIGRKPAGEYVVWVRVRNGDRRPCGTIQAGAEPVDLRIPPRE